MVAEGHDPESVELERFLRLRYDGTDFPLMVSEKEVSNVENIEVKDEIFGNTNRVL